MEKSCETCMHLVEGVLCGLNDADTRVVHCEEYKAWEPKKSCSTCRHQDMFSDLCCYECVNYSLWEPEESDIHTAQEAIDRASTALTDTQKKISEICDEIKNILLEKNRKYGDSALNPKRVFSKASPIEQINVRIDDKISRIMSAQDDDTEDAELDLIGYLILKRVAKSVKSPETIHEWISRSAKDAPMPDCFVTGSGVAGQALGGGK